MFARTDFNLAHDGIFSKVAVPPRDQLGRFLGELLGHDDDEDCTDCVGSAYALVAETVTADHAEEISEDDDEDFNFCFDDIIGGSLSPEEKAEMDRLNKEHQTEYYRPEDLMTLRRLDGLIWVEETYGNYLGHVAVKACSFGSSGFGSGEKCTLNQWECDRLPGRRGHDDGKKQRKAFFNRQLRSHRSVRVISINAML